MSEQFPHVQSAMVNAMREEASRDELADKMQELFNEVCALRSASARFSRLYGICSRILWSDVGVPSLANDQTETALSDLAEFLFMDGVDATLSPANPLQEKRS